jgi:hypothetical protein
MKYEDDEMLELKDGQTGRVPLMLRDAMTPLQRAVAQRSLATQLHDGHGGAVGHKPSFVYSTDASLNGAKEQAYRLYDEEVAAAHKHPKGWRGDLDASDEARDALAVMDERERAYRERDEADANAWRGPRDSGKW